MTEPYGWFSSTAATVKAGVPGSLVVRQLSLKRPTGWALVQGLAFGVCGTDRDLVAGLFGVSPRGTSQLVIGHESVGVIVDQGDSLIPVGTHVVGVVRYPDPAPCEFCSQGRPDLCINGDFSERGILRAHGFGSTYWVAPANSLIIVPKSMGIAAVLVEPASVVVKASAAALHATVWQLGRPARTALVVGGGTIGVLTMIYLSMQGVEVALVGTGSALGRAAKLARLCGARYSSPDTPWPRAELLMECSGSSDVAHRILTGAGVPRAVWLIGTTDQVNKSAMDAGAVVRRMVLTNSIMGGTVSSAVADYVGAAKFLAQVPRSWMDLIISRTIPLSSVVEGMKVDSDDIKVVVQFDESP